MMLLSEHKGMFFHLAFARVGDVCSSTASGSLLVILGLIWVSKPCNILYLTTNLSLGSCTVLCFGLKLLRQTLVLVGLLPVVDFVPGAAHCQKLGDFMLSGLAEETGLPCLSLTDLSSREETSMKISITPLWE